MAVVVLADNAEAADRLDLDIEFNGGKMSVCF